MAEEDKNLKQREEDNLELFQYYLLEVLQKIADDPDFEEAEILTDINRDVISLFDDDPDFQKKLENSLYKNQQKLTSKKFLLAGKPAKPTIGNWIRHFIKKEGTEMFDNVVLSRFLSHSENVKRLDSKEVSLVRSLVVLYRNLKFFPESMKGVAPEKWEMFPVQPEEGKEREETSEEEKEKEKGRGEKTQQEKKDTTETAKAEQNKETQDHHQNIEDNIPKSEQKKQKDTSSPKEQNQNESPQELRSSPKKPSREESRLEKLQRIKNNYPEDSLERKAIESEIRELQK